MDLVTIAQSLGVSVACLFAIGWGVWRSSTWLATNVVKPVADRHVKFIDELALAANAQSAAIEAISATMRAVSEHTEKVSIKHDVLMQKHDDLINLTTELIRKHDALLMALAELKAHVSMMEVRADNVTVNPPPRGSVP